MVNKLNSIITVIGLGIASKVARFFGSCIRHICLRPSTNNASLSSKASTESIAANNSGCVATWN